MLFIFQLPTGNDVFLLTIQVGLINSDRLRRRKPLSLLCITLYLNMTKVVVHALLATAFVSLIAFGPNSFCKGNHLRLGRRLGYKFRPSSFDPLVAKLERHAEEKENGAWRKHLENNTFGDSVVEGDERGYFNYNGKLNLTLRLITLFPLLDDSPKDGVVSLEELEAWITKQAKERLFYRTQMELVSFDKNKDGLISFKEYLPHFSDEDIERSSMGHGDTGWWKQQFLNADVDLDGLLSFDEFKDLLHPEDSDNLKIQTWLLAEQIMRMDYDDDGKLNYMEFSENAYTTYKNYVEYEVLGAHIPSAEDMFKELDVDKDTLLTVEELRPLLSYLCPGEGSYAKQYSSFLIEMADEDRDSKLTLEEMLNHEHIFYDTVTIYDNSLENFEENAHQEL